jgi:Zn-dependent peptidase ImmA (M78 family)
MSEKQNNRTPDKPKSKRQRMLDESEKAIGDLFADKDKSAERMQKMLEFYAPKASRWSFQNTLLVHMQKPGCNYPVTATEARKLGHEPKENANKASILVPVFIGEKETEEVKQGEDRQGASVEDFRENQSGAKEEGAKEETTKEVEQVEAPARVFFRPVECVLDLGVDTTGPKVEFLRSEKEDECRGKAGEMIECLRGFLDKEGVKLTDRGGKFGAGGYSSTDGTEIGVSKHLAPTKQLDTLCHEIAHHLLHSEKAGKKVETSKQDKEIQAETASYLVLRHFGMPAEFSGEYVKSWGAEPKDVLRNLKTASRASQKMIRHLSENLKIDMREIRVEKQEQKQDAPRRRRFDPAARQRKVEEAAKAVQQRIEAKEGRKEEAAAEETKDKAASTSVAESPEAPVAKPEASPRQGAGEPKRRRRFDPAARQRMLKKAHAAVQAKLAQEEAQVDQLTP